jgi:hypothetical protein
MRISFDLDDTLICRQTSAKYEKNRVPFFLKVLLNEPLRLGTRFLIRELLQRGHEVWIYTSSYRKPFFVKLWLRFYGIRVSEVVNKKIHDQYVRLKNGHNHPSKNPKLFGIDLHIDDSLGVQMEGDIYGFRVLVINPIDEAWVDKVIQEVNRLKVPNAPNL